MRFSLIAVAVVAAGTALAGCENMSDAEQSALSGGAIGAASGAALGAISGGDAAVGAAVGGAVGAAGGCAASEDCRDEVSGE